MNCPLCYSTSFAPIAHTVYSQCSHCGGILRDRDSWLTSEQEKNRYSLHRYNPSKDGYYDFVQPLSSYILKNFKSSQTGLDWGCGNTPVLATFLRNQGMAVSYYDPFFFNDKSVLSQSYDYIYACEVIEHFHSPEQELDNMCKMLKPEASFLIMTHVYTPQRCGPFEQWYYKNDPTHVFIYTPKTLNYIAQKWDFIYLYQSERLNVFRKVKLPFNA